MFLIDIRTVYIYIVTVHKDCLLDCTGPFLELDAEVIEEEVGNMWRAMHKLLKTFGDLPAPRRSADSIKRKLDAFKVNLPVIQTICNPGIRDRHWDRVSSLKHQ